MNARNLLIFVSTLAIVSYYAAIFYVWHHALEPDKIVYPGGFITLIGGTLATHFGAVFGMNRLNENSATPMKPLTWLESIAAWA